MPCGNPWPGIPKPGGGVFGCWFGACGFCGGRPGAPGSGPVEALRAGLRYVAGALQYGGVHLLLSRLRIVFEVEADAGAFGSAGFCTSESVSWPPTPVA